MYSVMGNENSQHNDCPRAKKSKTDDDISPCTVGGNPPAPDSCWERLPAVILDDIFHYLSFEDSIRASSTCRNWRQSLYHPRKWQKVNFVIEPKQLDKAQYFRTRAGHIATHANVRFNSIDPACVVEFLHLFNCFASSNNIKSLNIEPSHCTVEIPECWLQTAANTDNAEEFSLFKVFADIYTRQSLNVLTLGCNEELFESLPDILALLDQKKADNIETLALATVKEDPCNYLMQNLDAKQLVMFRRLQIFSLDYDNLSDDVLHALREVDDLRRLVVHVHGIWDKHPGTSEDAWLKFKKRHPECLLRLSCIHSTDEVKHLHTKVLKGNMPLSHLKVLFCEQMNLSVLVKLAMYRETFVSLIWVDNFSNVDAQVFLNRQVAADDIQPQELIILAWLCKKLEELVVIGYKFYEEDYVGIAKLRADTMRRLEVANSDLILCGYTTVNITKDISQVLGRCWAPLPNSALHPSIVDSSSTACYTDEYLMPLLLADLK
ncbi:F-box/LRR-repeat protein 21-like [Atheta coriaria]|uniref:F-box/LRR-repeat protein 21-like n=1 Tax=Dalotia coriaria TaxID=877792 RepID=UPI0031F44021